MLAECDADVSLAIRGNLDEAEQLFRACAPGLRRLIAYRLPRSMQAAVDADDVLQESLAEAFQELSRCRATCTESFFAWLRTIAEHNMIDLQRGLFALRRDVRRNRATEVTDSSLEQLALDLAPAGETPSRMARTHELSDKLRAALDGLPEAYRTVIVHYDLRQLPIDAVAEVLGCSVGAVYMRRQRAHRMLRRVLASFSRYL